MESMKQCLKSYFLKVNTPSSVSSAGLFDGFSEALRSVGIASVTGKDCSKLVGVATDGASCNIANAGLKGLIEEKTPWVFWMWCLAHRLELAIKDALKGSSFDQIYQMLLCLYYLYEKSPKKCGQPEEIIDQLKECLLADCACKGKRPIRASGSRWTAHKLGAMKRILSNFGAYTNHLASLSQDSTLKSADKAKIVGYYRKWTDVKYLLGCAVLSDMLNPCAILSKVMQHDHLDIVEALTAVLMEPKRHIL